MRPYLLVMEPEGARRFPLAGETVRIGRSPGNDLRINDLSLSREHAVIQLGPKGWIIEDRGSRNGTQVNGRLIKDGHLLQDGDTLRLGNIVIVFYSPESSVKFRSDTKEDALPEGTIVIRAADLLSSASDLLPAAEHKLLSAVSRTSSLLIAHTGSEEFYDMVLAEACDAVKADGGALLTLDPDTNELAVKATKLGAEGASLVLSNTIVNQVLQDRSAVLTRDAMSDPRFDASRSVIIRGIRSAMCVPLWHESDVMGVMYVDRLLSSESFSQIDLTLFTVLANLTAAKITNLALVDEALAKRKLEEEIKLAAEIQKGLLPRQVPKIKGLEIMGIAYPSRTVGGDLFDYFERPSGFGFLVGDVSGKGVSAALVMAALQANMRALLKGSQDLVAVFREVNDALYNSTASNKFATLFYGEIDPATGKGLYINAGHNAAIKVSLTGVVEMLDKRNILLGAFPTQRPHELGYFCLEQGDLLFVYSDGVTETENAEGELYGEERLKEVLKACRNESLPDLHDRLLDSLQAFRGDMAATDDTTFVAVRRTAPDANA